jgi:hypothetical protein
MEIIEGTEYSIIRMPENLSVDAVDGILENFCKEAKARKGPAEYLLDMEKIPQLHRAALLFIQNLHKKMAQAGCTLSVAGISDPVENALRFQHVHDEIPLYKTIIDFERTRELDFDFSQPKTSPEPKPAAPSEAPRKKYNVMVLDPSIASRNNQKLVLGKLAVANLIEASDTQEALKRLRSIPLVVDIVVADFEAIQPILADFVRKVRTLPSCKDVRIVAATIDANGVNQKKSSLGIDAAIPKNYTEDDAREIFV